ncbi:MAG: type II secretion system F family protein [Candidatus Uhrbacteria bacterium]|nr:type II secretion system F family protein [Candidatus Uhrbacteria bacterium]
MPTYKYRVRTEDSRIQAGLVDAANPNQASEALTERGFEVMLLEPYEANKAKDALSFLSRVKAKDIVIMSRTLSVMVSASVPLVDALKNIAIQTPNPTLRQIMMDVASEVESGARLSDAFERHPKTFGSFFVNMIRSGETSGQLQQVLEYLADQQEKDYDLTSRIRGAFIYPAFVITALGVVGFLMITFVIPSLTAILEEAGGELPISTRMLIGVSSFFQQFWVLIIFMVGAAVVGAQFFIRTPYGREFFDTIKLRMPIFGKLFQDIYVVRFSRSLGTLISGGVDQVTALEIVAGIVGNQVWRRLVFDTIREVNEGNSITTAFLRSRYVPTLMNQMIAVGEETGRLQEVLDRVSDFFKREVDNLVRNLVTLIEPIVMVILGLAVGVMVSAILLPLYNMSSAV